ncbi:hypothetical protein DMA11_10275 [Marinilabiliaceae bacterium JC017]|nr:hypothetical protein DMA11_10275 [Marinilabiliaceae bacterium JC017]
MNFLERLQKVKEALGFTKKTSELTDKEKIQFAEKYKEAYGVELDEDLAAFNAEKEKNDKLQKAFDQLPDIEDADGDEGGASADDNDPAKKVAKINKQIEDLKKSNSDKDAEIEQLQAEKEALEKELEDDDPKKAKMKIAITGNAHSDTHLFAVNHPMYAREKRWNQLMVDPSLTMQGVDEEKTFVDFQTETRDFGKKVAERMQVLQAQNLLRDPEKLQAQVDYSQLGSAGLGEQFVVRRVDALIARIIALPNVYDIFPRRFGVQDREMMTNAFFGEFSQPYQEGEVWKGDIGLEPEWCYVDDAMMKTLFKNWKWLERQYVGYLNEDGSDPIKWNMIEWAILHIATKLTNEQYKRRIVGIYRKPIAKRPANAMHSSTGYIYTMVRYIHENKLLPFADEAFADYSNTGTEMIDTIEEFVEKVKEVYEGDVEELTLYLNKNHKKWYKSGYRQKYGTDGDFSAVVDNKLQDEDVKIIWVPNMGSHKLIMMSKTGNFQCIEDQPGEMLKIKFKEEMESVKAWSIWKEGFSGTFVGKPFNSLATLKANNFELQEVFVNKPSFTLAAEATTANANNGFWHVTGNNTAACKLTDITNAKEGVGYIVECGGLTNATTVDKAGKFDQITEAFSPSAIGDYLQVVYDKTDDKFLELERCMGGTRTINKALQPNMPGNGGR